MLLRVLEFATRRRGARTGGVWTAVSLAVFLLRLQQQRAHRHEIYLREELKPGETLVISHTTEPRG
jgi:hypothetical protein